MRFYKVTVLLLLILLMPKFSYATYKEDLIIAIGNTYTVGKETYTLPEDIRVTAVNYLRTHYFTEEQCKEILGCINDAVAFANQIGTLDITKISGEDIDKGLSYAYKAIDIAKSAPTYEELEKLEQEKKEVVKVEKKVENITENKVENEVTTQSVNTEDMIVEEKPVSKTYEDDIDYSKYIDENQFEDVNFEDVKSLVIKEATNYSIKKFVPYILGVIFFIIAIIFVVKKIRGGKR